MNVVFFWGQQAELSSTFGYVCTFGPSFQIDAPIARNLDIKKGESSVKLNLPYGRKSPVTGLNFYFGALNSSPEVLRFFKDEFLLSERNERPEIFLCSLAFVP